MQPTTPQTSSSTTSPLHPNNQHPKVHFLLSSIPSSTEQRASLPKKCSHLVNDQSKQDYPCSTSHCKDCCSASPTTDRRRARISTAPTTSRTRISRSSASPNPPRHPLPVVSQALHSTHASRLHTGTTLLVQPILTQPSAAARNTRASTRRGGMINYAKPGSGDEFPDAGAIESDDSDFVASGGTRTTLRTRRMGTGMSVFHSGSGMSTPQSQAQARSTPMHSCACL